MTKKEMWDCLGFISFVGLPWWIISKETACQCRRHEFEIFPGLGRFSRGGHGNMIYYFCLENPMDRGAWRATVHGVEKESDMT